MSWIEIVATPHKILAIALLLVLLLSKKYRVLRFTQLYLFIPIVCSILYNNYSIFFNWNFYYFKIALEAALFTLCFWEVYKFYTGKSLNHLWVVLVAILLLPFTPMITVAKIGLSFAFANIFVVFQTSKILESRKPMLYLFVVANSFALAIDGFKLFITYKQVLTVMKTIETLSPLVLLSGMIAIVAWQPVRKYVHKTLHWMLVATSPKLAVVHGSAELAENGTMMLPETQQTVPTNIVRFPGSRGKQTATSGDVDPALIASIKEDMEQLEPVLKTAAQMVTLSKKPFLDRDELAFYMDMDESDTETFVDKYKISKLYLTDGSAQWVVRRLDVDYLIEEEKI